MQCFYNDSNDSALHIHQILLIKRVLQNNGLISVRAG